MMPKGPINSVVDPTVVALAIRGGNAFITEVTYKFNI